MDIPSPSWTELITALISAFVGWLAGWLRLWLPPTTSAPPPRIDKDV